MRMGAIMRYLIPILVMLVLASGVLAACSPKTEALSTYTNNTYNYLIKYPSSWKVDESEKFVRISDDSRLGVDIRVLEIPLQVALDSEKMIDLLTDELRENMNDFHLLRKGWLVQVYGYASPFVADSQSWEIVFSSKEGDSLYVAKVRQVVCLNTEDRTKNRVYTITAMSRVDGGEWLAEYLDLKLPIDSSYQGISGLPPRTNCMIDYILNSFELRQ